MSIGKYHLTISKEVPMLRALLFYLYKEGFKTTHKSNEQTGGKQNGKNLSSFTVF